MVKNGDAYGEKKSRASPLRVVRSWRLRFVVSAVSFPLSENRGKAQPGHLDWDKNTQKTHKKE